VIAARYRLVRTLGVGGMGSVWLAHDLLLDSACALKLIDDDKARTEEVRVRFAREAKVAAQLRGAHVVDVFDHGEWEGVPYIAMEFLDGEDLGTRLDRTGVLDAESTHRIVAHVARALARAHALGIVHRDLKPENVFLVNGDEGEIAKVVDFGIAKHDAYSLRDKATKTGSFLGTPYYVSPEQARGKSTDHRSDLWSLGVIAFQCLTGRPPFESEALGELMGLILYEDLPMPSARNPALPAALDDWWRKAAAREREERFQSAKELSDALGVALGLDHLLAVPAIAPRRSSIPDADGSVPPGLGIPASVVLDSLNERASRPPFVRDDDERGTDAPLSHTRHTGPGFGRMWERRLPASVRRILRAVPRRHLAGGAVFVGVAAGVALTLFFTRSPSTPTAVELAPSAPLRAAPVAERKAASERSPAPAGPPAVFFEDLPLATPSGSGSAPSPASSPSSSPARKGPVRAAPPRPRDYGI
jgi:serine/threonine-protein kinase